jgi:hypothetical protein
LGNNYRWFLSPLEKQEPIVRNFIVDLSLNRDDIVRRYGAPSGEADCGSLHLLLYDDPAKLAIPRWPP